MTDKVIAYIHDARCSWVTNCAACDCGLDDAYIKACEREAVAYANQLLARAERLFVAVTAHNDPGIWLEQSEDDDSPTAVLIRTDANAEGFDLLAGLLTDWRCEDWR